MRATPHLCATPCRRSCARAAGGAVISAASRLRSRYRKFNISSHFSPPPACARRRNVHQSCRYSQVHTRRRSLARMSRPLMRAISADAMLRRAGAAVARHPPPQKSANFCRLFGVWRRGGRRRAGNIPAKNCMVALVGGREPRCWKPAGFWVGNLHEKATIEAVSTLA